MGKHHSHNPFQYTRWEGEWQQARLSGNTASEAREILNRWSCPTGMSSSVDRAYGLRDDPLSFQSFLGEVLTSYPKSKSMISAIFFMYFLQFSISYDITFT